MKRKNQNKCYRARAVILIIEFKNICQIFRPITLGKGHGKGYMGKITSINEAMNDI